MNIRPLLGTASFLLLANWCSAQQNAGAEPLLKKYVVVNRLISAGTDAGSVHLNEGDNEGIAWINGLNFNYGIIELDIKGRDQLQKSFVGVAYHGQNDSTFEVIYFRPFNFRSTDPIRKTHSVQWVAPPQYDWSKLRTEFPNKYEQPVSPVPDPNDWFHARIVVEPKKVSVYVNGSSNPSLVVEPLVPVRGNKLGYWVGNGSDGNWKNLVIKPAK